MLTPLKRLNTHKVIGIFLVVILGSFLFPDPSFSAATMTNTYTAVGSDPTRNNSPMGDMDNDGDLDWVTGNSPLQFYRNNGSGAFTQVNTGGGGDNNDGVALGDLNGDGYLDAVQGTVGGQPISVLLNNGIGASAVISVVGWQSAETEDNKAVALGDFNNDGYLDILAGNSGAPNRIYINNGNGTFVLGWSSPDSINTYEVDIGDIDGDGDLDFVAGNRDGTGSQVFKNNNNGTFTNIWTSTPYNTDRIRFEHFNGDGLLDIVAANNNQHIKVYQNNGNDSFSEAYTGPHATNDMALAVGDINGDGNADIVFGGYQYGKNMLAGDGAFGFTQISLSVETADTKGISLGDVDGDGDLDLASGDYFVPDKIYNNNFDHGGTPPDVPTLIPEIDTSSGSVKLEWSGVADDNTPGNHVTYDLRVGTTPGGADVFTDRFQMKMGSVGNALSWSLVLSAGVGTRTYYWSVRSVDASYRRSAYAAEDSFDVGPPPPPPFTVSWNSGTTYDIEGIALGDYDNDGDLDQLHAGYNNQPNRVYQNDGTGNFTQIWESTEAENTRSITWGDYDGDEDLDQLVGNLGGANRVYRNDGGGVFTPVWLSSETDNSYAVFFADVDNDGDLDQVVGNENQPNRVYRNEGGDVFTLVWSSSDSATTIGLAVGDLDGDGVLDMVVSNSSNQANQVFSGNGDGTFSLEWTSSETDSSQDVEVGDFDGDGDLDFVVVNAPGGSRIYLNSGGFGFAPLWASMETEDTYSVDVGDFNGDGELDFLTGGWGTPTRVYLNQGGLTFQMVFSLGGSPQHGDVKFGDLDNDGDLDFINSHIGQNTLSYINTIDPPNSPPGSPTLVPEADGVSGSVTLVWSAASDDLTNPILLTYNLRVGTYPGGNDVFTSRIRGGVPGNVGQAISHSLILSGGAGTQTYYWSVQAIDTTGYLKGSFAAEDSFNILTDANPPPEVASVQVDGPFQSSPANLSTSWVPGVNDPESGTVGHLVEILDSGLNVVSSSEVLSPSFMVNFTNLSLTSGESYTVRIKSRDAIGNLSSVGISSSPVLIDTTPPGVVAGVYDDGEFQVSTAALSSSWESATDSESPISNYLVELTDGGVTVHDSTLVSGNVTAHSFTGFSFVNGETYYVKVTAINAAGLTGSETTGNGIMIDNLAPIGGAISYAGGPMADLTASLVITPFTDAHSGLSSSLVIERLEAPRSGGVCGLFGAPTFLTVVSSSASSYEDGGLVLNTCYKYQLVADDLAGNQSVVSSSTVVEIVDPTDTTPPSAVTGISGSAPALDSVQASWNPSEDLESGILHYEVILATSTGDVVSQSISLGSGITFNGLSLTEGGLYKIGVSAVNNEFLSSSMSFSGTFVATDPNGGGTPSDTTPPDAVTGISGSAPALDSVQASWNPSEDLESGILHYEVILATSTGDVVSQSTSLGSGITFNGLSLTEGGLYKVGVSAVNNEFLSSSMSFSGTFAAPVTTSLSDSTAPPEVLSVLGPPPFITVTDVVSASWVAGQNDPESGTTQYLVKIYDSVPNLISFSTVLSPSTNLTFTGLTLTDGSTYHVRVYAQNGEGLFGNPVSSATFIVDTLAPTGGSISYPGGPTSGSVLTGTLVPPSDNGSGLSNSAWIFRAEGTFDGSSCGPLGAFALVASISSTDSTFTDSLQPGTCYQYQYKVADLAGYIGEFSSNEVVQVLPLPVPDTEGPIGGGIDYANEEITSTSVELTLNPGTDNVALSNSAVILRTEAGFDGEVCGDFGSPEVLSQISSGTGQYTDETLEMGRCYQYHYTVFDSSDNFTVYTSSAIVKVTPEVIVVPVELSLGFNQIHLGLVTPGTFSLYGVQTLVANQPMSNLRLAGGPLTSMVPLARAGSTVSSSLSIVLTEPAVIPTLGLEVTEQMMVKVMVPSGTSPGNYEGVQTLYADLNNDFIHQENEPSAVFNLALEVPDFGAFGAVCPIEDIPLPPRQTSSAGGNNNREVAK